MSIRSTFGFRSNPRIPRRVLFFGAFGDARFLKGEEQHGLVDIPGYGAVKVLRDSTTPMYSGRLIWPAGSVDRARSAQKRSLVLTVREDDPTPLVPAAGYDENYQGSLVGLEDKARLRQNEAAFSAADHAREGALHDALTQQLMLILVLAMFGLIASAIAIPILKIVRG